VAPASGGEGNPTAKSAGTTARRVSPSGKCESKLYSKVVEGVKRLKQFQLTAQTKLNRPPEAIKELLKNKVNPTEINLGINNLNHSVRGLSSLKLTAKRKLRNSKRK
jgi:hypothetical protein